MNNNKQCSVCNSEVQGKFCSACGQKIGSTQTTLISIFSDFFSNFFSVEKSIFATLWSLLVNPKLLVDNYYNGHRRFYPSPGKLLLYALAVAAIHLAYFDSMLLGLTLEVENVKAQILFWLIFMPLLAISSYLTFLKDKISFTKNLISICYVASCFFILVSILTDLQEYIIGYKLYANKFFIFLVPFFIWNSLALSPTKKVHVHILNFGLEILIFLAFCFSIIGALYLMNPETISIGG